MCSFLSNLHTFNAEHSLLDRHALPFKLNLQKHCTMLWKMHQLTLGLEPTCSEGVPNVSLQTRARGHVVQHLAHGVDPARAGAGVNTLVPLACFIRGTVGVDHTFRPAGHIGVAKVFRYTLAGGRSVSVLADSIATTGRRVARVHYLNFGRHWKQTKQVIHEQKGLLLISKLLTMVTLLKSVLKYQKRNCISNSLHVVFR